MIRLALFAVALGLMLGLAINALFPVEPPDWTVAPCSWWSTTVEPNLLPYTLTARCVGSDGTIHYLVNNTQLETR